MRVENGSIAFKQHSLSAPQIGGRRITMRGSSFNADLVEVWTGGRWLPIHGVNLGDVRMRLLPKGPEEIVKALDNLSAAVNDRPRPHDDLLPFWQQVFPND
jgi:hypothetical protein